MMNETTYHMGMQNIIEVKNLVVKYGEMTAVDDITFSVKRGSLFSFLGVNGAGKSTTINVLTTLLAKTSGEVMIDGQPIHNNSHVRNLIGVVFQDSVLDSNLTVKENLTMRGSLYGLKGTGLRTRINEIIQKTKMGDYANRRYGKLSGGQRRRADIARALINNPKLLFLDEPTTGLDPKSRQDIWELIRGLQTEHNMTIFLTTHYMEEAYDSDQIVIIHKGKIREQGTADELIEKYGKNIKPKPSAILDQVFVRITEEATK